MGSFTSASQHYSNYADMPMVVHPDHVAQFEEALYDDFDTHVEQAERDDGVNTDMSGLEVALCEYNQMIENGVPAYEARQILPNACAVNIIWTVNARSLVNFFEQRLCKRNVDEMQILAHKVWQQIHEYWPELAGLCGPRCWLSTCNQGKMQCEEKKYERL